MALSKGSQRNHKESVHKQMEITDPSNTLRDCVRDYCALGLFSVTCSSFIFCHIFVVPRLVTHFRRCCQMSNAHIAEQVLWHAIRRMNVSENVFLPRDDACQIILVGLLGLPKKSNCKITLSNMPIILPLSYTLVDPAANCNCCLL